jgi:23S rRNA maturation mini-RNase III
MDGLMKGEATEEEEKIRNREHDDAGKKLKDVEYCAERKVTNLELVTGMWVLVASHESIAKYITDVDGTGFTRVWKQSRFHSCRHH